MSIKDLFSQNRNYKIFSDSDSVIRKDAESIDNVAETKKNQSLFIPTVDFSLASNFVNYGSAELYYSDAITRIYEDYPYDGSSKEREEFLNKSTYLDLWLLDNKYPRTNGFITISATGWGSLSTAPDATTAYYGNPSDKEYISLFGGPHTASDGMINKKLSSTFDDSNKYDTDIYNSEGFVGTGTRESNLKTNFDNGVTVEFWLKKESFDNSKTQKEVIFDLWNNTTSSAASYGRLLLQLTGTAGTSPFILTIQSGTSAPYEEASFGSSLTTASLETFGHYAFRVYKGTDMPPELKVDMYKDGNLIESKAVPSAISEITGALQANIGSLTSPAVSSSAEYANLGWGKLSGSIDEFRFWKTKRTAEEIGRNWFTQVYGGSNTDVANTDLGVYYKFNEGITGNDSLDSTVLDYSGRITNGQWTGYNTSARSTESAMVISNAATSEFKDPIIYQSHPDVVSLIAEMQTSGSNYDANNHSSIMNKYPIWIIDEDHATGGDLKRMTQIVSSFLDTLHLQIQELNKLKDIGYTDSANKNLPFSNRLLLDYGFVAPEIFADADLLNTIMSRGETKDFKETLPEIKNTIYKNIYNNIVSIFKSKGTHKAFRNLIRCYGIDDKIVRVNSYANNLTYDLKENKRYSTIKRKFIDFYRADNFYGTIYQQTSSANPLSTSFISASQSSLEDYISFTLESEIITPKKRKRNSRDFYATPFVTSSIFGFHTAIPATPADLTWASTDYDIQAYAILPPDNGNNKAGYFLLTSSYYGIEKKTSLIENLYDNKKWNLSLTLTPSKKDANLVSGSSITDYDIKLYGINTYSDVEQTEFTLTDTITTSGEKLLTEPKRIYAGAHRQNFTGSVIHGSDIKLSSVRYWVNALEDSVIKNHSENSDNFGSRHPLRNVHNFVTSIGNVEIPQIDTLALHWAFNQITSSDAGSGIPSVDDAGFDLLDMSSGSSDIQSRYSWLGNVVGTPHTGRGDLFYPNDTRIVNSEFIPVAIQENPEVVGADNTVKVLSEAEEQLFNRQTRPTTFTFMAEKSMYAAISDEILNYFSTILDFNNLIGDPVNKYRQEYKALGKLRSLFFENVQNEPDVERYIEYYKWIDDSLGYMLMELFPASADKQEGLRNMIESHILERNKYWNKYPTVDLKQDIPTAGIRGINELTYNWEEGHAPVSLLQNENCFWWKNRAERDSGPLSSGISGVDTARQTILSVALSALNRSYSNPLKYTVKREQIISSGVNIDNNIKENVKKSVIFGNSDGLLIPSADVEGLKDCSDDLELQNKRKVPFKLENQLDLDDYMTGKGDLLSPFVAVSSSVQQGYQKLINDNFKEGFGITNLHNDSYVENNVPLQGPFTEKFVGGNQNRHIKLNQGSDTAENRPEAWKMEVNASPNTLKFIHQPINQPRAMLYRGLVAKSPLNIANIKTDTGTHGVGNYSKIYEVVQTVGRTINNSSFTKAGGYSPDEIPSTYVAGMEDYAKPQRGRSAHVFVNRFSCPGDPNTMGDSNGGPGLDIAAAEYSLYNDINYRNWTVREPQRWLYASHVNQFGFYSDSFAKGNGPSEVNSLNYNGTASIYQVNRNTIHQMKDSGSTTVTASVYDNYYVQHPIPRTDLQYSWLTASVLSYDAFGYLPYDGEESLVTFSSASDFRSRSRFRPTAADFKDIKFGRDVTKMGGPFAASSFYFTFLPTAYNWLNLNPREPLEYISSSLGFSENDTDVESYLNSKLIVDGLNDDGKASLLNSILLKRNGPYQHPTWKQIRGYESPLVKKWNYSNQTAYNPFDKKIEISSLKVPSKLDEKLSPSPSSIRKVKSDPPVISKYGPSQTQLISIVGDISSSIKLNNTFGNEVTLFANREISSDLNILSQNDEFLENESAHAAVVGLYADGALDDNNNPIKSIKYYASNEQIYPSSINMYSRINRERVGYKNTFWKNSRTERSELGTEKFGGTNSQGYSVSQSAWALDTSEQFGTSVSTFVASASNDGKAGELQNDYTFAYRLIGSDSGSRADLKPGPIYSRKFTLGPCLAAVDPFATYSWVAGTKISIGGGYFIYPVKSTLSAYTTYLSTEEQPGTTSWPGGLNNTLGHLSIFGGNAQFQAHEQAGYVDTDGTFISSPSNPFYDKYELYNQIMRVKNKDMSIIPEYRISDNVEKYLNSSDGFQTKNTSSYSIFGINNSNTETVNYTKNDGSTSTYTIQTSREAPQNSSNGEFYKTYSHSDFIEYFDIVSEKHDKFEDMPKNLTLKCSALKKFIAYDGFYPAERTLEIGKAFKEVYNDSIEGGATTGSSASDELKMRPILTPLFSPGILYNTIKSGIAVDYPIYTSSYEVVRYEDNSSGITDYYAIGTASNDIGQWHHRVQFEDILNPSNLKDISFFDMEPHPSCSLGSPRNVSQISVGPKKENKYNLSINNFLASTVDFFLEDSELTKISSLQQSQFKSVNSGSYYGLRIKMRRSARGQKREDSDWPTPQEYFSNASTTAWKLKIVPLASQATIVDEDYRMFTTNMYSRPSSFGPPMAGSGSFEVSSNDRNFSYAALSSSNPAVETTISKPQNWIYDGLYGFNVSHTPPYYNGEAWVDIIYKPTTSGQPTIDDIEANSEIVCWRIDGYDSDTWPSGDIGASSYPMHSASVNNYAMQLTSSINIFNRLFIESDEKPSENSPAWSVQTKFETPVLNFGPFGKADYSDNIGESTKIWDNVTLPYKDSTPWSGSSGQTTTPMGMWHQFGTIPDELENQGIFLEVEDIPSTWLNTRAAQGDIAEKYNTGRVFPLSNIVGFNKVNNSKNIGRLAKTKTISEAVVAVPFYIGLKSDTITDVNNKTKQYFKLSSTKGDIENELSEMRAFTNNLEDMKPEFIFGEDQPALKENFLKIRDKYVFPPEFDYFRNPTTSPVAMYIFEFQHSFDRDDLSYIWQNIAPKFGKEKEIANYFGDIEDNTSIQEAVVSHQLFTEGKQNLDDIRGPNGEKVQWMVFKVKQRAKASYNKLLLANSAEKTKVSENTINYNWPYDYFSMIEFAKIDSKISYGEDPNLISNTGLYKTENVEAVKSYTEAISLANTGDED